MNQAERTERLVAEMKAARKSFETVFRLMQSQNTGHALDATHRLVSDLHKFGQDLKSHYGDFVVERSLSSLDRYRELKGPLTSQQSQEFLHEIGKTLQELNREVRRYVSVTDLILRSLKRHQKKILQAASVLAALPILWMGLKAMWYRNNGLRGDYYSDIFFDHLYHTRNDKRISFRWNGRSAVAGLRPNNFSVRWTGSIEVPRNGQYSFSAWADDGVKLKIDNKTVLTAIRTKKKHPGVGTIELTKGLYPIEIQYFQLTGPSFIAVLWKVPGAKRFSLIPTEDLVLPGDSAPVAVSPGDKLVDQDESAGNEEEKKENGVDDSDSGSSKGPGSR